MNAFRKYPLAHAYRKYKLKVKNTMLDKYEIANRALLRAEQMKAHRRGRIRSAFRTAAMMLCMCIATAVAAYMILEHPYTVIDDPATPLAEFPFISSGDKADFLLPVYSSITIEAGKAVVYLPLTNPEGNQYNLAFEIVLTSTGETIYASGMVGPSVCVGEVTLERPLQAGEYSAVLVVAAFDAGTEVTGAVVGVTITAQ